MNATGQILVLSNLIMFALVAACMTLMVAAMHLKSARSCFVRWGDRGQYSWSAGCLVDTVEGLVPEDNILVAIPSERK